MAARKGLKKKILEWWLANPTADLSGREIESLYVQFGGATYAKNHKRRDKRGRVDQVTVENLIRSMPVKRIAQGSSGCDFRNFYERAIFRLEDAFLTVQANLTALPPTLP